MRFQSRVFTLAKDLETPHLYEDASAVDRATGRAAIADGVGSAIFSGLWARILTQSLVEQPPSIDDQEALIAWMVERRNAWRAGIDFSKLQWFQRPKMVDGAFSTILWMQVSERTDHPAPPDDSQMSHDPSAEGQDGSLSLRAYALGDTCLFHYRDDVLLQTFPILQTSEFGLNPDALRSIDRYKQDESIRFRTLETSCRPGDLIVLCTDAVALWAMQQMEAGGAIDWSVYWDMPLESWQAEIVGLRTDAQMRVDDCTLILLRITDGAEIEENDLDSIPSQQEAAEEELVVAEVVGDGCDAVMDEVAVTSESVEQEVIAEREEVDFQDPSDKSETSTNAATNE